VPVPSALTLCFGARDPDGYGICYNTLEGNFALSVSCYKSSPETDSVLFLTTLGEVLIELKDILVNMRDLLTSSKGTPI
jgi:hypothetical protein